MCKWLGKQTFLAISVAGIVAVALWGCKSQEPTSPPTGDPPVNRAPLKILIVEDTEFAENLTRLWNAQSDTKIATQIVGLAELTADFEQVGEHDILIYPSRLFGELASRDLLLKINPRLLEADEFNAPDILPLDRDRLIRWGDATLAVSMGHVPWVLMYRKDLLAKAGLEPPTTWQEYEAACQRLSAPPQDAERVDVARWTPAVEPTAPEWTGHLLLARTASYISHRGSYCGVLDLQSGEPLIAAPAYVRGLKELVARRSADAGQESLSPAAGWQRLRTGQCGLAIGWPAARGDGESLAAGELDAAGEIGIAPLPGAKQVYIIAEGAWRDRSGDEYPQVPYVGTPGRLISIAERSRRTGTAWGLVSWLSQKENQLQLSPASRSSFPTRYSLLPATQRWLDRSVSPQATEELASTVREIQQQLVVMTAPRFPDADRLLSLLSKAVDEAAAGESPQTALDRAQQAWRQAIDERGVETVVEEVELSLGL